MSLQVNHRISKLLLFVEQFFFRASNLIVEGVDTYFHCCDCPIETINLVLLASNAIIENEYAIEISLDILVDD